VNAPAESDTSTTRDLAGEYQVVARRYRPRTLDDLVGQEHVVSALRKAIKLNRVTHAYLFTGTRGVGKTSMARIFAKCLNCVHGPTDKPCDECDICKAISVGQDVDVIEIDGASNTGVDDVRALRENVGLRPSRARYKIYYIDEVHMLSTGAFNALLKTLEEPPEHVKFFFATTESHKIPITVLSRCQRFDFAGIRPELIVETLKKICEKEGVGVEPESLWTIARRAGGSMRDAQSLLERLLVHAEGQLTDDRAREVLGLASDDRMLDLLEAVAGRDLAAMFAQVQSACDVGVQPGEIVGGALELLRDAMVLAAGGDGPMLAVGSRQKPRLQALADRWGLDSILASLQILAETKARSKGNPQGRLIAELGLARVARMDKLADLADIVARIKAGGTPSADRKSVGSANGTPAGSVATNRIAPAATVQPVPAERVAEIRPEPIRPAAAKRAVENVPAKKHEDSPAVVSSELEDIRNRWKDFVGKLGTRMGFVISRYPPVEIRSDGEMICEVSSAFEEKLEMFQESENRKKIADASTAIWGRPLRLTVRVNPDVESASQTASAKDSKWSELEKEPMIRTLVDLFQAKRFWIEDKAN
jgi:DNA polymerase-3 subunit gamma/tau